jgi:hypothetical protein
VCYTILIFTVAASFNGMQGCGSVYFYADPDTDPDPAFFLIADLDTDPDPVLNPGF